MIQSWKPFRFTKHTFTPDTTPAEINQIIVKKKKKKQLPLKLIDNNKWPFGNE